MNSRNDRELRRLFWLTLGLPLFAVWVIARFIGWVVTRLFRRRPLPVAVPHAIPVPAAVPLIDTDVPEDYPAGVDICDPMPVILSHPRKSEAVRSESISEPLYRKQGRRYIAADGSTAFGETLYRRTLQGQRVRYVAVQIRAAA